MTSKWYNGKEYEQILISQFQKLTDKIPAKVLVVNDPKFIIKTLKFLDAIPTSGDKYKSFADETELLTMQLRGNNQTDTIEFYDGMLKTPATSILSGGNEIQNVLYNFLKNILNEKSS